MCYDRGSLQAYLDKEMDICTAMEVERHVSECPACAAVLAELRRNQEFTEHALAGYRQETAVLPFNSERAWSRFENRGKPAPASSLRGGIHQVLNRYRKLSAVAAAVVLIAAVMSYAPARSIAASFLTIFRAEKIQIVAINPDDLKQFEQVLKDAGVADIKDFGKVEVAGKKTTSTVTAGEAAAQAGFMTKTPQKLGDKLTLDKITLHTGSTISITPDVEKANSILKALGAKQMLPANLSGKTFSIETPAIVAASYTGEPGKVQLVQGPSPNVVAPDGVDIEVIRSAMLGIPSLPAQLKQQLSMRDWQRTVLIPDVGGRTQEVTVNGIIGAFVAAADDKPAGLLWQQNGIWYSLTGNFNLQQALSMAGALK